MHDVVSWAGDYTASSNSRITPNILPIAYTAPYFRLQYLRLFSHGNTLVQSYLACEALVVE